MDRLAKRIELCRKGLRWSQRELARQAGVNPATINHIERGGDAKLSVIQKIEKALGVTLY